MAKKKKAPSKKKRTKEASLSKAQLDDLVEEATADCYGESEEATGLFTMLEENLALPFETEILGVPAQVVSIEFRGRGSIVAVCENGRRRQAIELNDLPLPAPPPAGAEWIEAYRHWSCF